MARHALGSACFILRIEDEYLRPVAMRLGVRGSGTMADFAPPLPVLLHVRMGGAFHVERRRLMTARTNIGARVSGG